MQSFMVSLVGLVLSVSVGAEPLLKGRVWLASGPPAAGVQVRLFDLTDLRRSVGTTTDEAGHFALPLATVGEPALPQDFALGQNYPNPFNPSTIIPYQIPTTTHVRLEVFNLLGQRLATLVDGERPAGTHTAHWDATDAAGRAVGAGVYIYRLTGGGHTVSRRMVLIDGQAGLPAGGSGPRPAAAVGVQTAGSVYGLTVAGAGLIAYVDPAFRVGTAPVDVVLAQPGGPARMKVATGGILGDVNNDSQVDEFDVLYVALYSKDPSITLPNNGDISLGDVNGDGTVDLADGLLLALYTVNPSDPTLPPGIGQPVDGGDDHGDTPSSATGLAVGSSRSGQLEPGGDVDYFRVEVTASGELTVHTTGSLDTKGQLEDSAGAVLARDDDGGDGHNFRIAHTVSAGTYYLKVEGYNASTTGRYTIHASGPSGGDGPDLIVASASVSDDTLTPAQSFTLNATVRNQGTAAAAATTVDYYQSPDATITAEDAQVGTDAVSGLSADHTSAVSLALTAPSRAGTYYYGACVQSVSGEINTDNNCSPGVQVTVDNGDRTVNIPDANLRAVIAEALDKAPNATITKGEMATLTTLEAQHAGISDLTGLEFATNLTWLDLYSNHLTNISALSGLTNLRDLFFGSISDISALSGLTFLTQLRIDGIDGIDGNKLTDISALSGLTNLTDLWLSNNSITDISPLVANTGLGSGDEVSLSNNPLSKTSLNTHIPALESRGVTVHYDEREDDHSDTPSAATDLVVGRSWSGQIEVGGDVDYFRVQVSASGELTVHTTGSLDTKGQLEDSAGAVLASDDDGGDGHNFRIAHAVSAGTYYIKVEGDDASATGRYTIHASGPGGDGGPVNIADANLRAVIADALGKAPNATITKGEMTTLTSLDGYNYNSYSAGIRDLTGLEFATNLTELNLADNHLITDLSVLSGLTKLRKLVLYGNQITDISALRGLTNLTELSLGSNQITDISALRGLTNLTRLYLGGSTLTDISALRGLTNLTILGLGSNQITDISALRGLTNLTELSLGVNQITDISALRGLTSLRRLRLGSNQIMDISALRGLTNLRDMWLESNQITDISALRGLTSLRRLWLGVNQITDISALRGLTNLTWLNLWGNPLSLSSINDIPILESRGVTVRFDPPFREGDFDIELVFLAHYTESQKRIIQYAARRWMSIITEDLPDYEFTQSKSGWCGDQRYDISFGERIDDLRIYVVNSKIGGSASTWGGPLDIRTTPPYLPVLGCMSFGGGGVSSALHEIAHVLGFPRLGGFVQDRSEDVHFAGPLAIAAFDDAGGRDYTGAKVPLEKDGGHWRRSVLDGELMTAGNWQNSLSAITLQALADLGWVVDVTQADPYTLPSAAGKASAKIAAPSTHAQPEFSRGVGE